jgi:hypothetical protein
MEKSMNVAEKSRDIVAAPPSKFIESRNGRIHYQHSTRFERMTFAFGGQNANTPLAQAVLSLAKRGFYGRSSNRGFWSRKIEDALSFNRD